MGTNVNKICTICGNPECHGGLLEDRIGELREKVDDLKADNDRLKFLYKHSSETLNKVLDAIQPGET